MFFRFPIFDKPINLSSNACLQSPLISLNVEEHLYRSLAVHTLLMSSLIFDTISLSTLLMNNYYKKEWPYSTDLRGNPRITFYPLGNFSLISTLSSTIQPNIFYPSKSSLLLLVLCLPCI